MFSKNLDHLFNPDVNKMSKNASGARYDAANVNKFHIYLGAIFLLPIRLILTIPFLLGGFAVGKIAWFAFGCKYTSFLYSRKIIMFYIFIFLY